MATLSFTCDYCEGAHPEVLKRLAETNMEQHQGYGDDPYTRSAVQRIRQAAGCPEAEVFLTVGGTQTNATVIDAMLPHYEAVLCADTGHIAVHESGAVELAGHKVIALPATAGKLSATTVQDYLQAFYADPTWPHMAHPGMVYISFPTEYGTIYSRAELDAMVQVCRCYNMPLYIDGARMAYGLATPAADITLPELAARCDAFYLGGTKCGALCGEAVVFPRGNAPKNFFTIVKQHGALLAKGRLLGLQFDTLMADGLYLSLGRHADELAAMLRRGMEQLGIEFYIDSPTNQQFPILEPRHRQALEGRVLYEVWQELPGGRAVTRFATSWATTADAVQQLLSLLSNPAAEAR